MIKPNNVPHNDVQGASSLGGGAPSGRDSHASQVTPDRHPATVKKREKTTTIGTWNVRTMYRQRKLENIIREMDRMGVNILDLSEVRWKETGKITSNGHLVIYQVVNVTNEESGPSWIKNKQKH